MLCYISMKRKVLVIFIVLLSTGRGHCHCSFPTAPESDSTYTKHYFTPLLEVGGINGMVWAFDRFILRQPYAAISIRSIENNLRQGFLWDNDKLSTNMFFHPYNGGLYYSAARSSNLGYGTSVIYALAGSLMWEIALENEPPSINDLLATTIGGAAMGEVMVRLSGWLMANKSQSAVANISALLLSPTSWINSHLYSQQQLSMPLKINAKINNTMILTPGTAQYQFAVSANARYGNFFATANTKPFDAFESTIGIAVYPKPTLKEFITVGSLYSKEMNDYRHGSIILGLYQHFDYFDSKAIGDDATYMLSTPVAASIGICLNSETDNISTNASIYMKVIGLGAVESDHYHNIDRNYNMGQGVGSQITLSANYRNKASIDIALYQYVIYTFKGFDGEEQDLQLHDLYLNSQGNISMANTLVIKSELKYFLSNRLFLSAEANYFFRHTQYKYFPIAQKNIFEISFGIGGTF